MVNRQPNPAPQSLVAAERRGPVVGRFCRSCYETYALHTGRHAGKPVFGRDHVASPCAQEGEPFAPGADWWEDAVEVLPAPAPAPEPAAAR